MFRFAPVRVPRATRNRMRSRMPWRRKSYAANHVRRMTRTLPYARRAVPVRRHVPDSERLGFLDWVVLNYGACPWWFISGAFHALLLMLVTLIGMAVLRADFNNDLIVTHITRPPPPRPQVHERPVRHENIIVPVQSDLREIEVGQPAIVEYEANGEAEIVEVAEIAMNADPMPLKAREGEIGLAESLAGDGYDAYVSASLGLGTPSQTGVFGRPDNPATRLRRALKHGGSRKTELAVDEALDWLAKHQEPDGRWDARKYGARRNVDVSMTGFALLAFLGAGHTETVGKYRGNVKRAVAWLVAQQQEDGCLKPRVNQNTGYANAIAGMALSEAAGMARRPGTIAPAQRAMDYGVDTHQRKANGEWFGYRYEPQQKGDLSNTGWYIMQLKSSKVAGLHVLPGSFDGVGWFLEQVEDKAFKRDAGNAYDNGRHRYGYQQPEQVTPRRTAMGCLTRQFLGAPKEDLRGGVEWFVEAGGVPSQGKVDLYYWYYGTLCTFQQGEDIWQRWNAGLKKALLSTQRKGGDDDGSWDPAGPYSERWGRVGQTALSCLCLEVYYRYLPMYRE